MIVHRVNPTTVLTPDDWIVEVRPRNRKLKPFRMGVSFWLTEEKALLQAEHVCAVRNVGPAFMQIKRRWQWRTRVEDMHPENLSRFDKYANR